MVQLGVQLEPLDETTLGYLPHYNTCGNPWKTDPVFGKNDG